MVEKERAKRSWSRISSLPVSNIAVFSTQTNINASFLLLLIFKFCLFNAISKQESTVLAGKWRQLVEENSKIFPIDCLGTTEYFLGSDYS